MIDWFDRKKTPPTHRNLLLYCPDWCEEGHVVGTWNEKEFEYSGAFNEMFDSTVEKWALFMEGD